MRTGMAFRPARAACAVAFLLSVAAPRQAPAQPVLDLHRLVDDWPQISLYFSAACNGAAQFAAEPDHYLIEENGMPRDILDLACADTTGPGCLSVVLAVDRGLLMLAGELADAKAIGDAFVLNLDGIGDRASVLAIDSAAAVVQSMTTRMDSLIAALDGLAAGGSTRLWDGVHAAVQTAIDHGENACRAVVVFTVGYDGGSTHTLESCAAFANRNGIRVFAVGLGAIPDSTALSTLARVTGGMYFHAPDPASVTKLRGALESNVLAAFRECRITYIGRCMDGSPRTVVLSVLDVCGGQDSGTKAYVAPRDTSTFMPLRIELGSSVAPGLVPVSIPLTLRDNTGGEYFQPSTFTVLFDSSCCTFVGAKTGAGTLLDSVSVAFTRVPGGYAVSIAKRKRVMGTGVLMWLTFRTGDPPGGDTACCDIHLTNWTFDAGCFRPALGDGRICINPGVPDLRLSIVAPDTLRWEQYLGAYEPNPFSVRGFVINSGTRAAANTAFEITSYPAGEVSLIAPKGLTQPGRPVDIAPGEVSEGRWDMLVKPRAEAGTIDICMRATFDNDDPLTDCAHIFVARADSGTSGVEATVPSTMRLDLFPDPSDGRITIEAPADPGATATYTVYSLLGTAVRTLRREASGDRDRFAMDLGGVPRGVYLLVRRARGIVLSRRFTLL